MGNSINKNNRANEDSGVVEILYNYLRNWKWFLLSVVICTAIALAYTMIAPKYYRTSLSILLNEEKNKKPTQEIDLEALGILSATNNLDNEIVILSSPDLVRQVVDTLNLQTSYYIKNNLRKLELFRKAPFNVRYRSNGDNEDDFIKIELQLDKNDSSFDISGKYIKENGDQINIYSSFSNFPVSITLPDNLGVLDLFDTQGGINNSEIYYVEIDNIETVTSQICASLSVAPSSKGSSVLSISLVNENSEKGAAILYELVSKYNELNIRVNNQMAYNTSLFINERLSEISHELNDVEQEVVTYKQSNRIADLDIESQVFVDQVEKNEQKLMDIETQLNIISMTEKFIGAPTSQYSSIPILDIADPGLIQMISDYNKKVLYLDQFSKGAGEDNLYRKRLADDVNNIRSEITSSLKNVKSAYGITKNNLQKQRASTQGRIQSVPLHEKGLLEKVRLQRVKESLFLFLMQKREEASISIASTADKARVIVSPSQKSKPISPRSKVILFSSFILGLFIPAVFMYLKQLMKVQIANRDELERLSEVDVVGQIGKNITNSTIIVGTEDNSPIVEMFRSLRNRVSFIFQEEDHKVILVTSTMPEEGKTFVSLNLALSYALLKKKTLIIGADIRNPKLVHTMGLSGKKGLTNYLSMPSTGWEEYITKSKESEYLDVLTSGTVPHNPNELLKSPRLKELIEGLKEEYDIVILDTAPVGLVSDTYLINKYMDMTLYIVREGVTPKTAVNFINKQKSDNLLNNMYLVLNDTDLNDKYRYGYGRKYGYYNEVKDK